MKNLALLLLILSGCITNTYLPENESVPAGTNVIYLHSDKQPIELFNAIADYLAQRGFILQENKDRLTIITDKKTLMAQTTSRYTIFVSESEKGSKATIRGEWGTVEQITMYAFGSFITDPEFRRASWSAPRPNIVLSYAIQMARQLGTVTYGRD